MPRARSENSSAKLTIVYWRDIPAQIRAQKGRERHSIQLSDRFQHAIDLAAMHAKKFTADDYLEDWRQEHQDCAEDIYSEVQKVAQGLEAAYSDDDIKALIKAKGLKSAL